MFQKQFTYIDRNGQYTICERLTRTTYKILAKGQNRQEAYKNLQK